MRTALLSACVGVAVALTLVCPLRSASAATRAPGVERSPTLELEWRAPPQCPGPAALRQRVRGLVRDDAARDDAAAAIEIRETPGLADRYAATVVVRTGAGETARSLAARECAALVDALAVIVAFAIDPVGAGEDPDPAPETVVPEVAGRPPAADPPAIAIADGRPMAPGTSSAASSQAAAEPAPSTTSPKTSTETSPKTSPERPFAHLRLGGGAGVGPLPTAGPVLDGGIGVSLRRARLELTGAYWLTRDGAAPARPLARGRFSLWTAGLRGGYRFAAGGLEIPLLLGLEAGVLRGAGEELTVTRVSRQAWVALSAAGGLSWEFVRGFALWLELRAALALRRPGFSVEGPQGVAEVHRAAALAGVVTAGFELRLRGPRTRRSARAKKP